MKCRLFTALKAAAGIAALVSITGCNTISNMMNPFYESPKPVALLGDKNDHALNSDQSKADSAREALQQMSTYQRTHLPQPAYPVMQPAIVRRMWIPDHLNSHGDLVPAHYYYLKVLDDRWAVSDAFELERQLKGPGSGADSSIPYITADETVK